MKIITIIGARPQFIKAATLSRAISIFNNKNPDFKIVEKIIHTGQHYDHNMSDIFFKEMEIPLPDFNLGIGGGPHGAMTGRQLEAIEKILINEKPDWVIVFGDTNSTLAGALAASKLNIKVAHVEAGLRSFNSKMPEEVNRVLTDNLSTYLFCPTDTAIKNLKNEGFNKKNSIILNSGDVMYDAANFYLKKMKAVPVKNPQFVLTTIHRAENTDDKDKFIEIIHGLNKISDYYDIVFPIHPRTRELLHNLNLSINFSIIDPVSYFEMQWLLKNCRFVITDSGGLQKEAFFAKKYCITVRDETEWVELIKSNNNVLCSACRNDIFKKFSNIKEFNFSNHSIYGNGNAADLILESLLSYNA